MGEEDARRKRHRSEEATPTPISTISNDPTPTPKALSLFDAFPGKDFRHLPAPHSFTPGGSSWRTLWAQGRIGGPSWRSFLESIGELPPSDSEAAPKAEATPKAAAPKAEAIPNLPNSVEAGAGWPAEAASKAGAKEEEDSSSSCAWGSYSKTEEEDVEEEAEDAVETIAPAPSPAPQAAPEASRAAPTEAMDEWQALNSMTALAASSHSSMQRIYSRMEADRVLIFPIREGHPPIVQIRADAERCSDCSVFGLFSAQCSEHLKACLVAEPDARYLVPGT